MSKIWFITGASSGFGRALAEVALSAGHRVVATARDVRRLSDLEDPQRCLTLALDVTDAHSRQAAVDEALAHWGHIDVLVNNAGVGLIGAVEECSDAESRENFETNFFGPLALTRLLLPSLRGQGTGTIVNMSAAAAIANYPGFGIYGAAKAAMEMLSESLRAELAPTGIRVMLVQPGPFRTEFVGKSLHTAQQSLPGYERTSGKFRQLIQSMNGKQPGDPEKAAQAILTAVATDAPPLRLVLGKYAHQKVKKRCADVEAERQQWEALGSATEFIG
jgi:NAD(P)-dependent dehydrogenase (short-subunit alcohol dehydrogenase family)